MGIHKFTLLAITLGGLILYLNLVPDPFLGMNIIPASSVIPWGLNIKHPSVSPDILSGETQTYMGFRALIIFSAGKFPAWGMYKFYV